MPSPSSGTYADELLERARERRLVVKSGLNRDLEQRHGGLHHQLFRVLDAMLDQPLVSGDAERRFEGAGKVARGKPAFTCNIRKPDAAMQVLMKNFRRSSFLPWRKTSLRMLRRFPEYTVPLNEMRSEDKTELVEGKHRGSIAPPHERKNTLGDLGHNQIVFEHCQAIIIYPAKTQILRDVI